MDKGELDHALERSDVRRSPVNAPIFGLGDAGQLSGIWIPRRKAVAVQT